MNLKYILHYIDADGKKQVTEKLDVHDLQNREAAIIVEGGEMDWVEAVRDE